MTTDWDELERRRERADALRRQRDEAAKAARADCEARLQREQARRAEFDARLAHQQEQARLEAQRRAEQAKADADQHGFDRWPQPDWHLHGEADGTWSVHPICDDKARDEPARQRAAELALQRLQQQLEADRATRQQLENARGEEQRAQQRLEQQRRDAQQQASRIEQRRHDEAEARARIETQQALERRRMAEREALRQANEIARAREEARRFEQQERRAGDEARREAQARWDADDDKRRADAEAWRKQQEERERHKAETRRVDEARREQDAWWKAEDDRRRNADRDWQLLDDKRQREVAWRAALDDAKARDQAQARADDERRHANEQQWRAAEEARAQLAEARRNADAARAARDAAWQEHEDTVRLEAFYRDDLANAQRAEQDRRQGVPGAPAASDRVGAVQREKFKREWLDTRVRRGWPAIGNPVATQQQVDEAERRAHSLADAAWAAEVSARQATQAAWAKQHDAAAGEVVAGSAAPAAAEADPAASVGRAMVDAFVRWMRDPTLLTYPETGARGFWLPDEIAPWFDVGSERFVRADHLSCTTATFLAWVTAFGFVFEGAAMIEPLWVRPKSVSRHESLMRDVYWIWQREYERVGIEVPYPERKGAIDVLGALGIGREIESVDDIERFDIVQTVVLARPKSGHSSMVFDVEKKDGRLVGITLISANLPRGRNPIRFDHYKGWRLRDWLRDHRVYIGRFDARLPVP